MKFLLATAAVAAIAIASAFALAPQDEVQTEIVIAAPPQSVWDVLADGGSYPQWNPFIVSMTGTLAQGGRLENVMAPTNGSSITFRPTVLKAQPARELRWLGRLFMPRLFDGEHYFVLEEAEGGTRLVHGERFHGILIWFIDTGRFRADFERMNAALKERVEASAAADR